MFPSLLMITFYELLQYIQQVPYTFTVVYTEYFRLSDGRNCNNK